MNKKLRAAVFVRAKNACEGCGRFVTADTGHLDHFWGRAKREETLETCWALCVRCDDDKTQNRPTRRFWLVRYAHHVFRHKYTAEYDPLRAALAVVEQKRINVAA